MSAPNNLSIRIKTISEKIFEHLINVRRFLHAHPELSFEEKQTSEFVVNELNSIGIPITQNVGGYGVVGLISGKNPNKKCIALRADMDALPIQELNNVSYKSKHSGKMHACGHDVHTTILLGAARILNQFKNEFEGTIKLIFQPGEEKSPGGASLMIKAGVLKNPTVDEIVGLHVYPEMKVGNLGFKSGYYMASSDEINIRILGTGGHAALPHNSKDPIFVASNLIVMLYQAMSRLNNATNPCILTFGSIHGGQTNNIIPDIVELKGTLRTFNEAWRIKSLKIIENIVSNICKSFDVDYEINTPPGYPSLYNNPELTQKIIENARGYLGEMNIHQLDQRMTAEDFSFYGLEIPASFFRLGTNTENKDKIVSVHHPNFDVDETCLKVGAGFMAYNALQLLI